MGAGLAGVERATLAAKRSARRRWAASAALRSRLVRAARPIPPACQKTRYESNIGVFHRKSQLQCRGCTASEGGASPQVVEGGAKVVRWGEAGALGTGRAAEEGWAGVDGERAWGGTRMAVAGAWGRCGPPCGGGRSPFSAALPPALDVGVAGCGRFRPCQKRWARRDRPPDQRDREPRRPREIGPSHRENPLWLQ